MRARPFDASLALSIFPFFEDKGKNILHVRTLQVNISTHIIWQIHQNQLILHP